MKIGHDMAAYSATTRAGPSSGREAAPVEGPAPAAGQDKVTLSIVGQRMADQLAQLGEAARAAKAAGRQPTEVYQRASITNVTSGADFARRAAQEFAPDDPYFAHQAARKSVAKNPSTPPVPMANVTQPPIRR